MSTKTRANHAAERWACLGLLRHNAVGLRQPQDSGDSSRHRGGKDLGRCSAMRDLSCRYIFKVERIQAKIKLVGLYCKDGFRNDSYSYFFSRIILLSTESTLALSAQLNF